jgi:atypical dual specificity phosphatase
MSASAQSAERASAGPSSAATESVLGLRAFGVAFREHVILASVDLDVPAHGAIVLLGPGGTGKSTLLRTIAGFNAMNPSLRTWGHAHYLGEPLGSGQLPALVAQSARLLIASVLENIVSGLPERQQLTSRDQRALAKRLLDRAGLAEAKDLLDEQVVRLPLALQRHIAILRVAAAGPRLLCVDEPTADLAGAESDRLLRYLRVLAEERAVLVVLHNQQHARALGGEGVLLAGGVVQERQPIPLLFDSPRSAACREFARNGTCSMPAPDARSEDLDGRAPAPAPVPEAARRWVSDAFGPRGFLWLKPGMLAGTPRPGVFHDIEYDLRALQRVGVTTLVTLLEAPLEAEPLTRFGITSFFSPIPDMCAPTIDQAEALCQEIAARIERNEIVAVHCHAGLGRTGTALAAFLIWEGQSALEALESVRRVEPRWVQSEKQVAFLDAFSHSLERRSARHKPGGSARSQSESAVRRLKRAI